MADGNFYVAIAFQSSARRRLLSLVVRLNHEHTWSRTPEWFLSHPMHGPSTTDSERGRTPRASTRTPRWMTLLPMHTLLRQGRFLSSGAALAASRAASCQSSW